MIPTCPPLPNPLHSLCASSLFAALGRGLDACLIPFVFIGDVDQYLQEPANEEAAHFLTKGNLVIFLSNTAPVEELKSWLIQFEKLEKVAENDCCLRHVDITTTGVEAQTVVILRFADLAQQQPNWIPTGLGLTCIHVKGFAPLLGQRSFTFTPQHPAWRVATVPEILAANLLQLPMQDAGSLQEERIAKDVLGIVEYYPQLEDDSVFYHHSDLFSVDEEKGVCGILSPSLEDRGRILGRQMQHVLTSLPLKAAINLSLQYQTSVGEDGDWVVGMTRPRFYQDPLIRMRPTYVHMLEALMDGMDDGQMPEWAFFAQSE